MKDLNQHFTEDSKQPINTRKGMQPQSQVYTN